MKVRSSSELNAFCLDMVFVSHEGNPTSWNLPEDVGHISCYAGSACSHGQEEYEGLIFTLLDINMLGAIPQITCSLQIQAQEARPSIRSHSLGIFHFKRTALGTQSALRCKEETVSLRI